MIVQDFDKFMRYTLNQKAPFTLEKFVLFATSLVNFYHGSNLIAATEKKDTALALSTAFNAGIGNQITEEDLHQIADIIISDFTIDYSILNPIFA